MRFKRAMAASMAAVMAVSSAVVCQITASAEDSFGVELLSGVFESGDYAKTENIEAEKFAGLKFDGSEFLLVSYYSANILNKYYCALQFAETDPWKGIPVSVPNVGQDGALQLVIPLTSDYSNIATTGLSMQGYDLVVTSLKLFSNVNATKINSSNIDTGNWTTNGDIPAEKFANLNFDGSEYLSFSLYSPNVLDQYYSAIQIAETNPWNKLTPPAIANVGSDSPITVLLQLTSDYAGFADHGMTVQGYDLMITDVSLIKSAAQSEVPVSTVKIATPEKTTYNVGDKVTLTASVNKDATVEDKDIVWSSDNADVATVDETTGDVTFIGAGDVNITAAYKSDKTIKDTIALKAEKKNVTAKVTAGAVTDALADNADKLAEDAKGKVKVEAPDLTADDYTVSVKVDGKKYTATVALTEAAAKKYELTGTTTADGTISYKVTGLKLSTGTLPILASNTDGVQLTATVLPADLAEGEIEWTTADNTVATVENGLVKPVSGSAGGKTTITAAVKGTDVKATCEVSIVEEVNLAVSIKLDKEELSGTAGDKAELKADVTAQDTSKDCTSVVVWKSSDEKVATVSNGVVTFVGEGTAEITATAGDVSAVCKVSVKAKTVAVEKVTLDKTSAELTVGDTATLKASVTPDNATDKTVTWTSSDDSVASVKDGVVTAVKAGKAVITAKSGDKTATCTVTVKDKKIIFSGKADIKPTELNSWNDNVQIGAANVEETSVIRIRYSIIDGAQHQIKVQDGADWKVLTSIKTNEWGVTEVSKDGVLVIELNKADAEAVAKGGLAITGIGIRVEDVDFNVVEDSKKYPASTATKTEFVKTTVNSDNTLNMLAVFSISEEDAKNFEAFVVTVQRSSDSKIYYDIVETYYDAFDYTADGVMHEGVSENGKHLIVLNLVNADPSWGSITVKIEPAVPKG